MIRVEITFDDFEQIQTLTCCGCVKIILSFFHVFVRVVEDVIESRESNSDTKGEKMEAVHFYTDMNLNYKFLYTK